MPALTAMAVPAYSSATGTQPGVQQALNSVWAVPGEVAELTLASDPGAPGVVELTWTEPTLPGSSTVVYDVLRAEAPSGFVSGGGATCLVSGETSTTAQDPEIPDGGFFYLARAVNACGNGTAGAGREAADAQICE